MKTPPHLVSVAKTQIFLPQYQSAILFFPSFTRITLSSSTEIYYLKQNPNQNYFSNFDVIIELKDVKTNNKSFD